MTRRLAALTAAALRWLRSTRLAHRIVDALIYVPEPVPLPEPNQRLVDLIDATLARIKPYREAADRAGWTAAQSGQWHDLEWRALPLCETAEDHKFYIYLNLPVYLDILRQYAAGRGQRDGWFPRISTATAALCSDLNDLIDAVEAAHAPEETR